MRKTFKDFTGKKGYRRLTESFTEAASGYADTMQIGSVGEYQIFKAVINADARRGLLFVAGFHGNEQAPPWGVVKFLESRVRVPKDLRVVLVPLVNPSGYVSGTRENKEGTDPNRHCGGEAEGECKFLVDSMRDEKVIFLHTLHEDPGLHSFYLYYTKHKGLAEDLRELAKRYFSIYGKDRRDPVDGEKHKLHNDLIHDGLIPLPHTQRNTFEDRLFNEGVPYITTETPGKGLWQDRVNYNAEAIRTVIHSF